MPHADANTIIVDRSSRQRQKVLDFTDMQESISRIGQIQPIVVRAVEGGLELVAGERRLLSCRALNIPVEYKLWENLTALEAQIVELEENLKREDLHWHDEVKATARLHALYTETFGEEWSIAKTAEKLGYHRDYMGRILTVNRGLLAGRLEAATGFAHAEGILGRLAERRAESIVSAITEAGAAGFALNNDLSATTALAESGSLGDENIPPPPSGTPSVSIVVSSSNPVLNLSFLDWAPTYAGPKFNLIHCDFPYGVYFAGNANREAGTRFGSTHATVYDNTELYDNNPDLYFNLVDCFVSNFDRFASYSAHVVFWFSMNFYDETKKRLSRAGLIVQNHPLIWLKTDGRGLAPAQNIYPKRIYDTALLASRGGRPLTKQGSNAYPAPTPSNPIHPSQKSEPMLKFFLSMLVDETTTVFDPTCGSASALIAADELGARSIAGLELNPNYATLANAAITKARKMRAMAKTASDEIEV